MKAAVKARLSFFEPRATNVTDDKEDISKKTNKLNASPVVTRPNKPVSYTHLTLPTNREV